MAHLRVSSVLMWSVTCVCGGLSVCQPHALLSRLKSRTSEQEQAELSSISESDAFTATLLPIKTVGVQVCSGSSI